MLISMMGVAGSAGAQQSPSAAPTQQPAAATATAPASTSTAPPAAPAAQASTAPAQPQGPSADVIKQARQAGYHMKTSHGNYYFCKEDADIGSRLATEKCIDSDALALTLERQRMDKEQIKTMGQGASSK
jgi:pyruvate/2-oxoglutarate dehydrogenase complex dihydrolipoamide acyltransferase (E2) component